MRKKSRFFIQVLLNKLFKPLEKVFLFLLLVLVLAISVLD